MSSFMINHCTARKQKLGLPVRSSQWCLRIWKTRWLHGLKIHLNYQETRTLPTESKEVLSVLCYL